MAEQEYDACFRDCEMSKTFTSQQMMELSANVSWKMAGPTMTDIVCKNPWFFYNTHVRSISDGKQPTYITPVISITFLVHQLKKVALLCGIGVKTKSNKPTTLLYESTKGGVLLIQVKFS